MSDPEQIVRQFLADHVLTAPELAGIGRDDHLLKNGILNSLTLTHLILALEEQLGISIPPSDFDPENFQSIRAICDLVERVPRTAS
jgi:acyl carrier protein